MIDLKSGLDNLRASSWLGLADGRDWMAMERICLSLPYPSLVSISARLRRGRRGHVSATNKIRQTSNHQLAPLRTRPKASFQGGEQN